MKKEDLFDTLGDINNQYIKEAHMKNKRKNNFTWAKWGTIAACFAVVLVTCVSRVNYLSSTVDDNTPGVETPLDETSSLTADTESLKHMQQSGIEDLGDNKIEDLEDNKEESQNVESKTPDISDMPVTENQGSTGALVPYDEVWGGSYPNEAGQWVILLTENTTENQKKVFELNSALTEDNTIFKTATYSLDYLENLMQNISQAVDGNEELAFVSSIGLREEKNCVQVTVTTEDSVRIAKVLAFDAIGGAIEIIYLDNEANSSDESQKGPMPKSEEYTIEDAPADSNGEYNEAVNSSDLTKDTSEFFGGSYTDANGKFVIVLTEDTPENRTAICNELGRSENNTTFVTGTYTLAYLTELQAKISNAMVNKQLPFVVSSGLYETANNIVVGVTTTDESELAKVYAFDTLGGAIKIEFRSSATTDLLAAPKAE